MSYPESIKFLHLRRLTVDGKINGRGGETIAYRASTSGVEFASAYCSVKDNYNKAYGRAKTVGRLASDRFRQFATGMTADEFRAATLRDYYGPLETEIAINE
jgi:hypothetical protein